LRRFIADFVFYAWSPVSNEVQEGVVKLYQAWRDARAGGDEPAPAADGLELTPVDADINGGHNGTRTVPGAAKIANNGAAGERTWRWGSLPACHPPHFIQVKILT